MTRATYALTAALALGWLAAVHATCIRRNFGLAFTQDKSMACECNATHCDSLSFRWPRTDATFLRVLSTKAGLRFAKSVLIAEPRNPQRPITFSSFRRALQMKQRRRNQTEERQFSAEPDVDYIISVDASKRRQRVAGYGGAFTDSATQVLASLPAGARAQAYADYFGPHGLDYNMGRVPIGGTDMSVRQYSYDDLPAGREDLGLDLWRLQPEDLIYKIPAIRLANALRRQRQLEPLKLVAASWSGPAWLKSNRNIVSGHLRTERDDADNSTLTYYDAYARYTMRFVREYARFNISIWGLAAQNEPRTPSRIGPMYNFNSVKFSPKQLATYLEQYLVPQLEEYSALDCERVSCRAPHLLLWDDTLDDMEEYVRAALAGPRTRALARGCALHWYSQGLRELPYSVLHEAAESLPNKGDDFFMLSTEASYIGLPQPGNWDRGARYARDILENLRVGSVGWIDWNLALDMLGGPTWAGNRLDAAILVDETRGVYYKNPMYYALGHVSRFIRAGSRVLDSHVRTTRLIDLNEVTVAAGELAHDDVYNSGDTSSRKVALVVLNRAQSVRKVRLDLLECAAKSRFEPLELELEAASISSFAFLC